MLQIFQLTDLAETKFLAKISEGNMVANVAEYHKARMLNLFNRHKEMKRKKARRNSEIEFLEGVAVRKKKML